MPRLGSLFDGIGGFPLAAERNGITPAWASEIEAFPIEVTKSHFPDMEHVGDITQIDGAELPPVEVISGGSPCQDLSVAGQRAGLAGERSGLFMEQIRIVKEMRDADERRGRTALAVRPRYMLWENVPGAFSSEDGEDFRAVLEETCRIADDTVSVPRPPGGAWKFAGIILGDRFSVAWRVMDAQYWGVAQRRKRIFLVADFAGHSAGKILFEQDRLLGDSAKGGGPGQGAAAPARAGAENPSGADGCLTPWDVQSRRVHDENGTWPALYGSEGGGRGYIQKKEEEPPIAFACNQRDEVRDLGGRSGALQAQPGMKQQTFVAQSMEHPRAGRSTDCLTPWDKQKERIFTEKGVSPTLACSDGGGGRNPGGLVFSAGFCAGAAPTAGGIGYQEECAPTLKSAESGTNMVPSILCLNDQGGERMDLSSGVSGTLRAKPVGHQPLILPQAGGGGPEDTVDQAKPVLCLNDQGGSQMHCTENVTGTLRAQEHGHQPLVFHSQDGPEDTSSELFENHGIDSRYTGPHDIAPTMSARYGTGGNNVPLVKQPESFCISGNIIDRQAHNGGNHFGYGEDICYTLNTADRHAVFNRPRIDQFQQGDIAGTQSARQHKDATDIVCDVAGLDCRNGNENGDLCGTLQSKTTGGYSLNNLHPVRTGKLIRRLTPTECERLQGFPDGWTALDGASDSSRYKALGNSVAIPCVEYIMRGISYFLRQAA